MNLVKSGSTVSTVALILLSIVILYLHSHLVYAPCDDAYIYLVYVNNLFEGKGLTYNGEPVQGFSSLLWPWLIALAHFAGAPLPVAMEQLSHLSGLSVIWLSYITARRVGLPRITSALPGFVLTCSGDVAFYTGNGLETALFAALLLSVASRLFTPERWAIEASSWSCFLQFLLLCLIRPEGMAVTAFVIVSLSYQTKNPVSGLPLITKLAVVLTPIYALIRVFYGNWLPATYHAKSGAGLANLGQGINYTILFAKYYWPLLILLVTSFTLGTKSLKKPTIPLALIIMLWMIQVSLQGGDNMVGFRMYVPVLPLTCLTIIYTFRQIGSTWLMIGALLCGGYLFTIYNFGTVIGSSWQTPVKQHAQIWRSAFIERRDRGLWLKQAFPPDSRLAISAAGITPFYAELPTLDMLGLNNRHIALYGHRDRSLTYGHQAGDGRYILDQRPVIIFLSNGLKPGNFLSDREIWSDSRFQRNYAPCKTNSLSWAWIRKDTIWYALQEGKLLNCRI